MTSLTNYEAQRLEKIKRNKALIQDLGIKRERDTTTTTTTNTTKQAAEKKRRKLDLEQSKSTRSSSRIASALSRPTYNENERETADTKARRTTTPKRNSSSRRPQIKPSTSPKPNFSSPPSTDIAALQQRWTSWNPSAPSPTDSDRDALTGTYHFPTNPEFTPNKSPADILREGAFGGSYFRPLYSAHLRTTISDDWRELPADWIDGLNVNRYLTNPSYDTTANKFGVACGQSIEEWERSGWIAHEYDVRGWFQWYCRFWMGRRCDDDERQIARWKKCVGETGRWRRALLKKYMQLGVRDVFDEGEGDEAVDVSPVMHQTCHHWAFEVRQGVLDESWASGGK